LTKFNAISANIEETTSALRDPTGIARKVLDPQGSLMTLLDDDNQLYNQINAILEGIKGTSRQLEEFSGFLNEQSPEIDSVITKSKDAIDKSRDVLQGIRNNPLIRGGISEKIDQPSTFQSYRDQDF
jgi:phospholipid/cholesterol/gamma-HCH transport system substrate-binding protein